MKMGLALRSTEQPRASQSDALTQEERAVATTVNQAFTAAFSGDRRDGAGALQRGGCRITLALAAERRQSRR
jgi:hypothetical protein